MQRFRKISAILLSLLVLLSSTSFTLGMHFCLGRLESISFFSEAEPCEMARQKSRYTSEKHNPECGHKIAKKSCCEDHTLVVQGSEEISIVSSVSSPDVHLAAAPNTLVLFKFIGPKSDHCTFSDYSPPPIERDRLVLFRSFLI